MKFKNLILVIGATACIFSLQAQTPQPPTKTVVAAKTQQAPAATEEIFISRSAIALDIEDREPVDTSSAFPPEVKRLYCFTEIKNGAGHEIQHRWYWKDEMITSVSLNISSNRYRTQSAKTIVPNMTGDWRVAIVDSKDEKLLKMINFVIK